MWLLKGQAKAHSRGSRSGRREALSILFPRLPSSSFLSSVQSVNTLGRGDDRSHSGLSELVLCFSEDKDTWCAQPALSAFMKQAGPGVQEQVASKTSCVGGQRVNCHLITVLDFLFRLWQSFCIFSRSPQSKQATQNQSLQADGCQCSSDRTVGTVVTLALLGSGVC